MHVKTYSFFTLEHHHGLSIVYNTIESLCPAWIRVLNYAYLHRNQWDIYRKYLYIIIYIQTRTCNFKPNTCVHGGLKRIRPCQPKNYPTGLHASVKNLTQSALANLGGRLIRTPPFFFTSTVLKGHMVGTPILNLNYGITVCCH